MRNVWATVLSVWALFAVIAFLAWTRQQPTPANSPQSVPGAVIVKGKNGTSRLVVVPTSATGTAHATTRTSPVPAG
jgi:cyanate permease